MKERVKLIMLGFEKYLINWKRIEKFKNDFFEISGVEYIHELPEPKLPSDYLDVVYSRNETSRIMQNIAGNEIVLGIMNFRFEDNFYLHRTGEKSACLSLYLIDEILLSRGISIENFIIKNIFEIILLKKCAGSISGDNVYQFVHQETRKCLFDMNGDKNDVIFNTEKPLLCGACKNQIDKMPLPAKFTHKLEKNLKKIKKPKIIRIEKFIKKYPLLSLLITVLTTIILNIGSDYLWYILEMKFG